MTKLTNIDLDDLRTRSMSVREYFDTLSGKAKDEIVEKYEAYRLDGSVLEKLKEYPDIACVVFSAAWCIDCKNALPVFRHLEEQLGMEFIVFGSVKTDPLNPDKKWASPPSPPEINEWDANAIPWIVIFDKNGNEIGTIIEKPHVKDTLEAEILYHLESNN
ncbi:MAG: thioredoxin family protein [Candidatus Thorarchaeota archaeon]|nr:thioredoxin family protein [Candidatus Thorarchaeota archaeon]